MENLWNFTRAYSEREPWRSMPFPSYVCVAFTNPEMTRRIREERDFSVRVIGRCVEALVIKRLATDINLRNVLATHDKLACLSAILGTKSDDVKVLLHNPGAIEFTKLVFLALVNFYSFNPETVPSDIADVVQVTFNILSQDLPDGLNVAMPPDHTDTLVNALNGQCELVL